MWICRQPPAGTTASPGCGGIRATLDWENLNRNRCGMGLIKLEPLIPSGFMSRMNPAGGPS